MGWIREEKPVRVLPGMGLIALPYQRYVEGEDGEVYGELYMIEPIHTPLLHMIPRTPSPLRGTPWPRDEVCEQKDKPST